MSTFSLKHLYCVAWLALVTGGPATAAALAHEGRSIAVVTLIADGLRVVGQEGVTGTLISSNPIEVTPLAYEALELPAMKASMQAVLAADSNAKVLPMKIVDPGIYAAQGSYIDNNAAILPKSLVEPLLKANISHLLLVTRLRADARLNTGLLTLGSGKLEGVGYYLDPQLELRKQGSSETTVGYLAPYVYARVSLINLKTMAVERSMTTTVGRVLTSTSTGASGGPWAILTDVQKIETLRNMIGEQLTATVTKVVGP